MKLVIEIKQMEEVPFGYGFYRIRPEMMTAYYAVFPFNLVLRLFDWVQYSIVRGHPEKDPLLKAYQAGYEKGFHQGYEGKWTELVNDALIILKKEVK